MHHMELSAGGLFFNGKFYSMVGIPPRQQTSYLAGYLIKKEKFTEFPIIVTVSLPT